MSATCCCATKRSKPAELLALVEENAGDEMFFRMDLKPPYPDTPNNWEDQLEAAFSRYKPNR